ncbi:diguanylate cyclase [Aestuariibacter halophilus]|uniref:diguanylate cyclase n=1 Tax=Fluctibacter halophilus TaxID=226011 RepID=A0ABS8GBM2_9ALTE|nr:diguanylate cyclase [Aestuariibacter halophilus]MCC2617205.1 diguanylate cyclase [Aestuariibacter halophilus]
MQLNLTGVALPQRWLLFLVCLLGAIMVWGVITVDNTTKPQMNVAQGVQYLSDNHFQFGLSEVLELPDMAWEVEQSGQLSFGMADYPYWIKFSLPPSASGEQRLLEIDYALLDDVTVWFVVGREPIADYRMGDGKPFVQRPIPHEKFLVPVPYSTGALEVVVKLQSAGTVRSPIKIWQEQDYLVFNGEHNLVMGLFFGFLAAMALSNLFFFVTTKSLTFLSYCGYVICLGLTLATLHGLAFKYLWPNNVWLEARSVAIFATLTIYCAIHFTRQLLNVKAHSTLLETILVRTAWVFLFATVSSLVVPYSVYIKVFILMLIIAVLLIYFVGMFLWYRGVKLARFYTIAWTALLVSGFITGLDNWDLVQLDTPSHYLLMFGATVETFLLALALALSYSHQRQHLYDTQVLALQRERLARQSQEELLKIKEEAQEELEYKVEERTLELEIALRELSEMNRELEKRNTTDALTGVRNRLHFDKRYPAEVRRSRREQTDLAIVMIDIDHFKPINDEYGHLVGDECLRHVASLLQRRLKRPSDDLCRYGGEEFAMILPNTDEEGAKILIEELRKTLEETPVSTSAGEISMTLSAGICSATVKTMADEQAMLRAADQALYQAKREGRNRVCVAPLSSEFLPK